jgi:antitoxin Phd
MYKMTSTEVQNGFGKALQKVALEPVSIARNNTIVAVLISPAEYERLSQLEDYYLGLKALEAKNEGMIGPEAALKLLNEKMASD